jgi:hypothetical protein
MRSLGQVTPTPSGIAVRLTVAYVALAGVLEIAAALAEVRPLGFWAVWDAGVRGGTHFLLALGLHRRLAICRSITMIYCLAVIIMYLAIVALAIAQAPFHYPPSVILQSLYHVPSGVLVFRYLRSPAASGAFPRPMFGGPPKPPNPTNRACSGPDPDL